MKESDRREISILPIVMSSKSSGNVKEMSSSMLTRSSGKLKDNSCSMELTSSSLSANTWGGGILGVVSHSMVNIGLGGQLISSSLISWSKRNQASSDSSDGCCCRGGVVTNSWSKRNLASLALQG